MTCKTGRGRFRAPRFTARLQGAASGRGEPALGQRDPGATVGVRGGHVGRAERVVGEAAAGDAGMAGHERGGAPVEGRATGGAEEAVGLPVRELVATEVAAHRDGLVGKVGGPAERAAGALLAVVAVADRV